MLFIGKLAQELTEADLADLIGIAREAEAVDFKEYAYPPPPDDQLPPDQKEKERIKNEWKISLCTDLSAMANANGGWIICGMKEQGGVATEVCGLGSQTNTEREIARLGQAANTGLEPLINGLEFGVIQLSDTSKSVVIAIRIPKSFRAPHRVKATRKFYIRRSGRNDEMNIDELRSAFNLADSIVEQIKTFRAKRIEAISVGEHEDLPVILPQGMRIALHLVPLSVADPAFRVNLQSLDFAYKSFSSQGHPTITAYAQHNLDGVLLPARRNQDGTTDYYYQVFRNGACEYVETMRPEFQNTIPLGWIEAYVSDSLEYQISLQKHLGIAPPAVAMLSLVGVRGMQMTPAIQGLWGSAAEASSSIVQKQNLLLPDVLVENFAGNPRQILKPIFDVMWNAGGWQSSKNYDENGNFIKQRR